MTPIEPSTCWYTVNNARCFQMSELHSPGVWICLGSDLSMSIWNRKEEIKMGGAISGRENCLGGLLLCRYDDMEMLLLNSGNTISSLLLAKTWQISTDQFLPYSVINVISNWVTNKVPISFIWVFLTIYSSFFEQVWEKLWQDLIAIGFLSAMVLYNFYCDGLLLHVV